MPPSIADELETLSPDKRDVWLARVFYSYAKTRSASDGYTQPLLSLPSFLDLCEQLTVIHPETGISPYVAEECYIAAATRGAGLPPGDDPPRGVSLRVFANALERCAARLYPYTPAAEAAHMLTLVMIHSFLDADAKGGGAAALAARTARSPHRPTNPFSPLYGRDAHGPSPATLAALRRPLSQSAHENLLPRRGILPPPDMPTASPNRRAASAGGRRGPLAATFPPTRSTSRGPTRGASPSWGRDPDLPPHLPSAAAMALSRDTPMHYEPNDDDRAAIPRTPRGALGASRSGRAPPRGAGALYDGTHASGPLGHRLLAEASAGGVDGRRRRPFDEGPAHHVASPNHGERTWAVDAAVRDPNDPCACPSTGVRAAAYAAATGRQGIVERHDLGPQDAYSKWIAARKKDASGASRDRYRGGDDGEGDDGKRSPYGRLCGTVRDSSAVRPRDPSMSQRRRPRDTRCDQHCARDGHRADCYAGEYDPLAIAEDAYEDDDLDIVPTSPLYELFGTSCGTLRSVFRYYCRYRQRWRKDTEPDQVGMDGTRFARFCRELDLLRGPLTRAAADLCFIEAKGKGGGPFGSGGSVKSLDFEGFLDALLRAAMVRWPRESHAGACYRIVKAVADALEGDQVFYED